MEFKFKIMPYQTHAVDAVVNCFQGQPKCDISDMSYRMDPEKMPLDNNAWSNWD